MKFLILLLLIATPLFAQEAPLSESELGDVRAILVEKVTLINLARGITNETVPIQIRQLEKDIELIIATRDSDIQSNNVAIDVANRIISDAAEVLIDAKESDISVLRSSL